MAKGGEFDFTELIDFANRLDKFVKEEKDKFIADCAKEIAARLLAKVIKRTPVGKYGKTIVRNDEGVAERYKSGKRKGLVKRVSSKKGGTLRRGWTAQTEVDAVAGNNTKDVKAFVQKLEVQKAGNVFKITINNPVHYAPYVEYGHVTSNRKDYVKGQYMLTISEKEINRIVPALLEKKLKEKLAEVFR